ncbi:MAG: hypothetical protein ACKVVT_16135 [Dehalococcoidia bacterium]
MTRRKAVHAIIDYLPDDAIEEVEALLEQLQLDRLKRAFADAPLDDEPLSPAEAAGIERGEADLAAGRWVPHEDVLRLVEGAANRVAR